ncbi:hypothetical protein [uncultured Modestobacter sp.]|uniref:hypothetical protein n=1 Tax=uncultured Modestobacter sp. TaxID=380048 RepID=UPI002609FC2A|nr:hypothetical protein [uncultured Modestobacter sp.]
MGRRRRGAAAASSGWLLVGGVLAGCGADDAGTASPLDVTLDGFHAAGDAPPPTTLCAPDPGDPVDTPPQLPAALGRPDDAFLLSASTAVEAHAWTLPDADAAQDVVAEATAAASACTWTSAVDLDGDGVPETVGAETQQVEEWSAGDWVGIRIVRTVAGVEQVDSRLVADGDLVLLVEIQTDSDDPADLAPADDYLAAVAERLG